MDQALVFIEKNCEYIFLCSNAMIKFKEFVEGEMQQHFSFHLSYGYSIEQLNKKFTDVKCIMVLMHSDYIINPLLCFKKKDGRCFLMIYANLDIL